MSVAKETIRRLMGVFGEPKTEEPDVFLREFEAALAGYDAGALQAATAVIIRTSTFWPRPAELIEVVESILRERERIKPRQDDRGEWSKWRMDQATRLVQCDLGRQAVEGGWVGYLWDFCRSHERLPTKHEVPTLIGQQREFDRMLGELEGDTGSMGQALFALGSTMASRAKQLGEIIAGERTQLSPISTEWPAGADA